MYVKKNIDFWSEATDLNSLDEDMYKEYIKNGQEKWVQLDLIISDLDDRISGINSALGNQEDIGYLKALETLLDYYIELSKKQKQVNKGE